MQKNKAFSVFTSLAVVRLATLVKLYYFYYFYHPLFL